VGFITSASLEGVEEVKRQLTTAVNGLLGSLPGALLKGGSAIEVSAKGRAPVRTGALRDSITTEVETVGTTVTVEIGPTVDYADDVEFGGVRRAAKPYLRPAADEMDEEVMNIIVDELNKSLETL